MKRDTEQMSASQALTQELSAEQKLEIMAREERLTPELARLWQGVTETRAHSLRMALDEVEMNLKREVVLGDAERVACVLWTAHTYIYGHFKMSPRLFITSGSPGSGKTTLLTLIAEMALGGSGTTRQRWLHLAV